MLITGIVVGFSDVSYYGRKFPIDNAGFALNVGFLKTKNSAENPVHEMIPYKVGYLTKIKLDFY